MDLLASLVAQVLLHGLSKSFLLQVIAPVADPINDFDVTLVLDILVLHDFRLQLWRDDVEQHRLHGNRRAV